MRRRWPRVVLAAGVVAGLVVLSVTWAPLRRQVSLSITKQPRPYVEMSFSNFLTLPRTVRPGVPYRVPFTLVAHGNEPASLKVTSTVRFNGRSRTLGHQVVAFGAGHKATGVVTFTPTAPRVTYFVVISLADGQSIQWKVLSV